MNCFFKILIVGLLFSNVISAQETNVTPIQNSGLQLEKPLVNQSKKLALLLPFNLAKVQGDTVNTIADRLKKDKFLNMTLDFYSGALVAIDSAKQLGVTVDVSVFDSEETKNSSNVAKLIADHDLENFSAVIGPFYQTNVEKTAELLSANQVAVISPLSKEMGKSYPNLFQTITPTSLLRSAIFDFMRSKNGNVIAVVDKKKVSVKKYIVENQKDVRLVGLTEMGALIPESLSSKLQKDRINYVVLETESTVLIKATLKLLLSKLKECAIQLVILEPNETLDTDEIEFANLLKLKLLYPSMTRENNSPEAVFFEKNYKLKNKVTPNAFATRGFDVTFDALMRLSQSNSYFESASTQVTEQVESKFDYFKNETGSFANKGLYLLYYDADLTVKAAK
jgi:Receptor family ligand binding region